MSVILSGAWRARSAGHAQSKDPASLRSAGNAARHSHRTLKPMTTSTTRDIVIIGGGHNGLVTAFYLAKAGYKPLVLERSAQVGGAAVTDEFHPGFRCSTLAHTAGPLLPSVVRDMQLEKHGLKWITPEVCVTALSPDGRALSLYQDAKRSAQEIAAFSQKDAAKYPEFAAIAGQNCQRDRRRSGDHASRYRQPQQRRSLEHAQDRARHPQTRQERYVPPAALGTHGRGRPGVRIF